MHTLEIDDSSPYALTGTCSGCPVDYDYIDGGYVLVSGVLVNADDPESLYLEFLDAHNDDIVAAFRNPVNI